MKNIVAGMSGNTAIQTLTVIARGIATNDFNFNFTSYIKAIWKEMSVGFSISLIMGLTRGPEWDSLRAYGELDHLEKLKEDRLPHRVWV